MVIGSVTRVVQMFLQARINVSSAALQNKARVNSIKYKIELYTASKIIVPLSSIFFIPFKISAFKYYCYE